MNLRLLGASLYNDLKEGVMDQYLDPKKRDLADYQDEMAGRETGRQERFFTSEASRRDTQRRKEKRRGLTTLERLLLDPLYAQAHQRAWHALERLQTALDAALLQTSHSIDHLERLITDLETRAARLGDGTAVFASADGAMHTAEGRRLSETEAAALLISADDPSWEQYQNAKAALMTARAHRDHVVQVEGNVAASALQRLDSANPPQTVADLDALTEQLDTALSDLTRSPLAAAFEASNAPAAKAVARPLQLSGYGLGAGD